MQVLSINGLGAVTRRRMARGVAGIKALLVQMRGNIRAAMVDAAVVTLAQSIVGAQRGKDFRSEAAAVQNWVRTNIRYTRDPRGAELLKAPAWLIKPGNRQDDCDGHAQLVAALLGAVGHRVRLVAIGFEPDRFAHVYAETFIGGVWVPVETTEPWPLGRAPTGVKVRLLAEIATDDPPQLGFLKKLGKAVKGVVKTAVKVAPLAAAVTVPGAAAALATVSAATASRKQAEAQLTASRADQVRAVTESVTAAQPVSAAPVAANSNDFFERYKLPMLIGGGIVMALLVSRR